MPVRNMSICSSCIWLKSIEQPQVWSIVDKHNWNGSFQKRSTLPPRRKFLPSGRGGETKLFLIIVNVLGHPKGVGGLTSNFLCGGGMDVFWNDPIVFLAIQGD
jgi:hypothetical protein